jgi:hypothetical protein
VSKKENRLSKNKDSLEDKKAALRAPRRKPKSSCIFKKRTTKPVVKKALKLATL